MADAIAVIIRFNGDPDELLGRFERARRSWLESEADGADPSAFFATCRTEEGIVLVTGWETVEDHRAFRERIGPHLEAAGIGRPDAHEHLPIARLGGDESD